MSGDEVLVTFVSVAAGPLAWALWLFHARSAQPLRRSGRLDVVYGALATSTLVIIAVLRTAASFDVVDDLRYQFMYLVVGLAWLRGAQAAFAFAGLSARDDGR